MFLEDINSLTVSGIGRGGMNSADNLRLRCPAHNRLEAEKMLLIPRKDRVFEAYAP